MDVTLYLKRFDADGYIALDLFKDEKIEINLQIKNLTDISKVRTDFTQNFSIPCSPTNNKMFDYYNEIKYLFELEGMSNQIIKEINN